MEARPASGSTTAQAVGRIAPPRAVPNRGASPTRDGAPARQAVPRVACSSHRDFTQELVGQPPTDRPGIPAVPTG